jgi:hypothetical protein
VVLDESWHRPSRIRTFGAGALVGVAVCAQQQRSVFLVVWLLLAFFLLSSSRPERWRTWGREIVCALAGTAVVVLVVLGSAASASSVANVAYWIYGYSLEIYAPTFSGRSSWAGIPPATDFWLAFTWPWLLRISPLFLVGELLVLLRRRGYAREQAWLRRACLWLLALLMALSVWYLPDFIHVSFVLPFLLIPGAALLHDLRSGGIAGRPSAARHVVAGLVWLFVLGVAAKAVANVSRAHASAPERVETSFGTLRLDASMARLYRSVHRHLVREPDGSSLLYSYPDDAWLYLALGAQDAARFSVLLPTLFPPECMRETIEVLRARRPGTVVLATPFSFEPITEAIEAGYDAVEEVEGYRIYVRRPATGPGSETSGHESGSSSTAGTPG